MSLSNFHYKLKELETIVRLSFHIFIVILFTYRLVWLGLNKIIKHWELESNLLVLIYDSRDTLHKCSQSMNVCGNQLKEFSTLRVSAEYTVWILLISSFNLELEKRVRESIQRKVRWVD